MFTRKAWDLFIEKWNAKKIAEFTEAILLALTSKKKPSFNHLSKMEMKLLLKIIEDFDHRIYGKEWSEIKREICLKTLFPRAHLWKTSRSWIKRNFSARCFQLVPHEVNEKILLKMLHDEVFLVSAPISNSLVAIESEKGILEIIEKMSSYKGFIYSFYRDLFMNCSQKVYLWIEEFANTTIEPSIHLVCLDILEINYLSLKKINFNRELENQDPEIRLAALKILAHNPQEGINIERFNFIESKNPLVRKEAIKLLLEFDDEKLEKLLRDENWQVRLDAALKLISFGKKGKEILESQPRNTKAYDAAQYALKFEATEWF